MIKLKSEDLPALLSVLQGEDLFLINKAAKRIAAIDPKIKGGIHALRQVLKLPSIHLNPEYKTKAAILLAGLGPAAKEAVPELIIALQDPHIPSREFVLKALAAIGPAAESAVDPISLVLGGKPDFWARQQAVETILKIGRLPEDLAGFLLSLTLSGADFSPLLEIAKRDKRIAPAIQNLFNDDYLRGIPGIQGKNAETGSYETIIESIRHRAIEVLTGLALTDNSARERLHTVFQTADYGLKIIAAGALTGVSSDAENLLVEILTSDSPDHWRRKREAVGSCSNSATHPLSIITALLKNLGEARNETGYLAGRVLARMANPEIPALLTAALKESSAYASANAAMALGLKAKNKTQLPEETIKQLKDCLKAEPVLVRLTAADALCKAGFKLPEILELYISFFKDPPLALDDRSLRNLAIIASEGIVKEFPFSTEIYFALLKGAASENITVYSWAIGAFENIGPRAKNFLHTLRELEEKEPYDSTKKYYLHEAIKTIRRIPKAGQKRIVSES